MSALCQKQTYAVQQSSPLFDHLVGAHQQWRRHVDTERLSSFEIYDQFVFGGLLDGQVRRSFPFKDTRNVTGRLSIQINYIDSIR